MGSFETPCNVGDIIYVVEDYNRFYDKCGYYETIYGSRIVIKDYVVEGFLIDELGVHIAEGSHDGWNKFSTYHDLTLEDKYGDCMIFNNRDDAIEFVNSIIDYDYGRGE